MFGTFGQQGGPNVSSSASSGPAGNNSINNVGNGSFGDLNRLLNLFTGPSENGGATGDPSIDRDLIGRRTDSQWMSLVILGGFALVAVLLLRK